MRLQGKKILIIDDDPVISGLLTKALETAGCSPIHCASVKSALRTVEKSAPDLILLDLNMPDHDGFTFLKFRRQNKLLSTIPVIVLSGTKDKKDVTKALEMGAQQFLFKPFETRVLLQKLRYIFLSKQNFIYKWPDDAYGTVIGELNATLTDQCDDGIILTCQAKFTDNKPVTVTSSDYLKNGGTPFVCIVDKHFTKVDHGLFSTPLSPTGIPDKDRPAFLRWLRGLK